MNRKVQWDAPSIVASLMAIGSVGAAAAVHTGYVEALLPPEVFGQQNAISCSLLSIQVFSLGVLLACSVYNNYAQLQLGFHGLAVVRIILLGLSVGWMENVIQHIVILAICVYLGFFYGPMEKNKALPIKWNLATILMTVNLLLLLGFCASPIFLSPGELFPQFDGLINTTTFRYIIGTAFVYVLPMAAAIANNKATELQPWWAVCLFYNTTMHMMMDPIDTQNAIPNFVLGVIHISSSAYLYISKSKSD